MPGTLTAKISIRTIATVGRPVHTHAMPAPIFARNNITILGSQGPTMLFAHGFGCDQRMWRFVAPAFAHENRVVLFDYVGAGKSDRSAFDFKRYSQLEGYAQDVVEICEALDLRDVIFVGHSVSAMIGLLAAIERPAIFQRLIFIGPSPRYVNDGLEYQGGFEREDLIGLLDMMDKNPLGWASYLAPVVMKNSDRPELAEELEKSFCTADPRMARRFAETTFFSDNRADLARLQKPSLIMQCSEDAIAPSTVGDYMHRHLAGSRLAIMQATGHCPHLSHPQETIEVIQNYLANPN